MEKTVGKGEIAVLSLTVRKSLNIARDLSELLNVGINSKFSFELYIFID